MQRRYNTNAKVTKFHIGSKVWLADKVIRKGESKKFSYKYKGPYRIAKMSSTNCWLVPLHKPSAKFQEAHLNNIKPFYFGYVPLQHTLPSPTKPKSNQLEPYLGTAESKLNATTAEPKSGPQEEDKSSTKIINLRNRSVTFKNL